MFILGLLAFVTASVGRTARRQQWHDWARVHITGMGLSYILLLTAFYVDNGKNLPSWRNLPSISYWLLPAALGLPIIVYALARHPVARNRQRPH